MITDPIANLLSQIKNGYLARKSEVVVPYSKMNEELVNLLLSQGYIGKVRTEKESKNKSQIRIELIYEDKRPKITQIVRVSKPGRRVYVSKNKIPKVLGGLGLAIISTPKGLMVDIEAKKKAMGGEVICKVW